MLFGPPTTVGRAVAVLPRRGSWIVDLGIQYHIGVPSFDDLLTISIGQRAASDSEASGSTQASVTTCKSKLWRNYCTLQELSVPNSGTSVEESKKTSQIFREIRQTCIDHIHSFISYPK
jgi:hypothetical protein